MLRVIWAIARRSFSRGTHLKTRVSRLTAVTCILFILTFFFYLSGFVYERFFFEDYVPDYLESRETILLVNTPESLDNFMDESVSVVFKRTNTVRVETNAYYDFISINESLRDNQAFMAIVFPSDFDEAVFSSDQTLRPQIITYFETSNAKFKYWHDELLTTFTKDYGDYLVGEKGAAVSEYEPFQLIDNETEFLSGEDPGQNFLNVISKMVIPLVIFIAILYSAMESGVAAVAGEKEKGTFAAILLTPVSRMQIVLGSVLGVFLHTLIPCAILIPLLTLGFGFLEVGSILSVIAITILLSLLLSTLIIAISIMNKSTLSAQTSFLPVFLILLVVCVIAMQEKGTPAPVYFFLPFYGHYHGISTSLSGTYSFTYFLVLAATSLFSSFVLILASARLLRMEQFTTTNDSASDFWQRLELAKLNNPKKNYISFPKASIFGYRPTRRRGTFSMLLYHFSLPMFLISLFQPIALIIPFIYYLRSEASTKFIESIGSMVNSMQIGSIASAVMGLFNILMQDQVFILAMSLCYVLIILVYLFIVKKIEKNPLSTIGMPLHSLSAVKKAAKSYGKGLLLGFFMISGVYLVLLLTGQLRPHGIALESASVPLFLAYILMWIPQGASEEIMLRGYMLPRVGAKFGRGVAVGLTSLLFGLLHAGNVGFSLIALINLILIAVFFALMACYTQEIFTVCAAHTAWNFAQGNLFGMQVSGATGAANLLDTRYSDSSLDWLTGGSFGPEGGLAVSMITVAALLILLLFRHKISKAKLPE
jgi:ABC-type Na+ efflux pump permease subunit/membrane protease YdiL (CAAX protease family)